ncbi:hypothetical protein ACH5RR_000574 [Cinchona calisaya]|uniref:Peptidase A1 domain-containing protein n=1 Tax=Cinchona calisaya TaxID=153742 RepID=A0ABD3B1K5_9GENT
MPTSLDMRLPHIFLTALAAAILSISCSTYLLVEANNGGFTVDLIHRDSPKSPYYNTLLTPSQRLNNAFQRSLDRAEQFASATMTPNGGEYLMKVSYGTPPFETLAVVETGSDHTWTQCLPCTSCPKEDFPRFNPKNSSTFEFVPCNSKTCDVFSNSMCDHNFTNCGFIVFYVDSSFTEGDLASETLTLEGSMGEKLSFPDFIFGCVQDGKFPKEGAGVVGLGVKKQSMISQLNSSINEKFSYCLGPSTDVSKPGKLRFGDNPGVLGEGAVSTPLFLDSTYSLKLEAISIADIRLEYNEDATSSTSGNILIDSGTPYTFLPTFFYFRFESTLQRAMESREIIFDPEFNTTLCYPSLLDKHIPNVTMHFTGADLRLNPENIFVRTSNSSVCLAFAPYAFGILGNMAQANFWVEYDLQNKIVSFQHADCTK